MTWHPYDAPRSPALPGLLSQVESGAREFAKCDPSWLADACHDFAARDATDDTLLEIAALCIARVVQRREGRDR